MFLGGIERSNSKTHTQDQILSHQKMQVPVNLKCHFVSRTLDTVLSFILLWYLQEIRPKSIKRGYCYCGILLVEHVVLEVWFSSERSFVAITQTKNI